MSFGSLSAVIDEKRTAYPTDCYTNEISEVRSSSPTNSYVGAQETIGIKISDRADTPDRNNHVQKFRSRTG